MNRRIKQQSGIILLECICVISLLAFIMMTTQPIWQLIQRQNVVGQSLAMIQAVLPVLTTDIMNSDQCYLTKQALRLEVKNDAGYVSEYIEYQFQNNQLIRKKNGGYERVGTEFSGEFQVNMDVIETTFIFSDQIYHLTIPCNQKQ